MDHSTLADELTRVEGLLVQGEDEAALELLARLGEDAEEYVDKNCRTTEETQWFSFPTAFERLAYRRIEKDPRELCDVGEPLDRLYADLAFAQVRSGDYDAAIEALKLACRWNPMECGYRLDLAELFRVCGNMEEYLALTHSVFERASDARHLVRAYLNFAGWFETQGKSRPAAGCLKAACILDPSTKDASLAAALNQASGTDYDPKVLSQDEAQKILAEEGLPFGANAEVAICLLMCATDAAAKNDTILAITLTMRAKDLVGEKTSMALVELIRQSDAKDDA